MFLSHQPEQKSRDPVPAHGIRPVPFDPLLATLAYRRHLPHWRQKGAAYFVTFRLNDSVPADVLERWMEEDRLWLQAHPEPRTEDEQLERVRLYGRKLLKYLDAGHGSCLLKQPDSRTILADALKHFEPQRYLLGDYAIMPNHVHALVLPLGDEDLTEIVASWTRYAAVRINRLNNRHGRLWQEEPFDHLVRDRVAYARFSRYIRDNPLSAPPNQSESSTGQLRW